MRSKTRPDSPTGSTHSSSSIFVTASLRPAFVINTRYQVAVTCALVKRYCVNQGKLTYGQAATDLNAIATLAAKGIPDAIRATNKAFDNFVAATDKGGAAGLKAIRDIGEEAKEVGIHSIEDLRKKLLAQGEDAGKVSALMTQLSSTVSVFSLGGYPNRLPPH